jgi:hypothetical protein
MHKGAGGPGASSGALVYHIEDYRDQETQIESAPFPVFESVHSFSAPSTWIEQFFRSEPASGVFYSNQFSEAPRRAAPHANSAHSTGRKNMSDTLTREEIDAKLGKVAAETDTKIAKIEGKLDLVLAKLDNSIQTTVETRHSIEAGQHSMIANLWVVGIGLAAIVVTMAVAFPSFFGVGTQVKDMVANEVAHSKSVQTETVSPPAATPKTPEASKKPN